LTSTATCRDCVNKYAELSHFEIALQAGRDKNGQAVEKKLLLNMWLGGGLFSGVAPKATEGGSTDCSNLAGCWSKNCNKCIAMFWGASPATCTPGCIEPYETEIDELKAALKEEKEKVRRLQVLVPPQLAHAHALPSHQLATCTADCNGKQGGPDCPICCSIDKCKATFTNCSQVARDRCCQDYIGTGTCKICLSQNGCVVTPTPSPTPPPSPPLTTWPQLKGQVESLLENEVVTFHLVQNFTMVPDPNQPFYFITIPRSVDLTIVGDNTILDAAFAGCAFDGISGTSGSNVALHGITFRQFNGTACSGYPSVCCSGYALGNLYPSINLHVDNCTFESNAGVAVLQTGIGWSGLVPGSTIKTTIFSTF
jgi:hypothetical protein